MDATKEEHVLVLEKTSSEYKVKVGSVAHPMGDKYLIEWIELVADGKAYRHFLQPGQTPGNRILCSGKSGFGSRIL